MTSTCTPRNHHRPSSVLFLLSLVGSVSRNANHRVVQSRARVHRFAHVAMAADAMVADEVSDDAEPLVGSIDQDLLGLELGQPDANLAAMLAALGPSLAPAPEHHRAGFVSIVGSPNVGKSTIMNALLGENLSIITPKASTTRQRIMGIANDPDWQIVYSDTPGVVKPSYKLHEGMMGAVRCAIEDADVILFITDVLECGFRDAKMLSRVQSAGVPVLVLINKVDLLTKPGGVRVRKPLPDANGDGLDEDGAPLLPPPIALDMPSIRSWWAAQLPSAVLYEVSALEGLRLGDVRQRLLELLPLHPPFFDKSHLSDRPEKFFAAEFVRAQIFEQYEDEIPYSVEVEVESFKEADNKIRMDCVVHVMRDSQKGILIGNGGKAIKALAEGSQKSLYKFFGKRVDLRLQVKVSKDWRSDDFFLRQFGYLR